MRRLQQHTADTKGKEANPLPETPHESAGQEGCPDGARSGESALTLAEVTPPSQAWRSRIAEAGNTGIRIPHIRCSRVPAIPRRAEFANPLPAARPDLLYLSPGTPRARERATSHAGHSPGVPFGRPEPSHRLTCPPERTSWNPLLFQLFGLLLRLAQPLLSLLFQLPPRKTR